MLEHETKPYFSYGLMVAELGTLGALLFLARKPLIPRSEIPQLSGKKILNLKNIWRLRSSLEKNFATVLLTVANNNRGCFQVYYEPFTIKVDGVVNGVSGKTLPDFVIVFKETQERVIVEIGGKVRLGRASGGRKARQQARAVAAGYGYCYLQVGPETVDRMMNILSNTKMDDSAKKLALYKILFS